MYSPRSALSTSRSSPSVLTREPQSRRHVETSHPRVRGPRPSAQTDPTPTTEPAHGSDSAHTSQMWSWWSLGYERSIVPAKMPSGLHCRNLSAFGVSDRRFTAKPATARNAIAMAQDDKVALFVFDRFALGVDLERFASKEKSSTFRPGGRSYIKICYSFLHFIRVLRVIRG